MIIDAINQKILINNYSVVNLVFMMGVISAIRGTHCATIQIDIQTNLVTRHAVTQHTTHNNVHVLLHR